MNVTFYTTADSPKKLEKTLTQIGTAQALAPTAQVNVLTPVLVVDYDSTFLTANYAYIDTFHRYYWISTAIDTAGRLIISCKVDYLYSWAAGIRSCKATITRSETAGINYVIDKQLPIDGQRFVVQGIKFPYTSLEFSNGVTYPQFVMITK